ncbi:MAG: glycoside hydrolase family 16 protein [Bacteroidetes bacterium]|nr:glycoside hydrolase family 16 protein [Bacteroidota bacterium]
MKLFLLVLLTITVSSFSSTIRYIGGFRQNIFLPDTLEKKHWAFESNPFWSDEFDYSGQPDQAKWGYDEGGNGWGNNELQYYTHDSRNASVADGILTISALKEDLEGKHYTSARLVTKNKADFLYGRIEVRAKVPAGIGTWPAIWMLPTDWKYGGWPQSGEIDIMEHVGFDPDVIHFSTHCEAYYWRINTQKTAVKKIENATTAFHLYRVDWTPDEIKGFIDGELIFTMMNEGSGYKVWPFDQRFHLLLNIAVGGDWGGQKGVDDNIFPASMQIDFVRYYKLSEK